MPYVLMYKLIMMGRPQPKLIVQKVTDFKSLVVEVRNPFRT